MSTFLVDPNASQNDIVGALNYALANLGAGTNTGNATAGVTQIVAGTNVSISPTSGNGVVTINASVSGNVTLSSNIVVANTATSGPGAGFVTNVQNSGITSPSVISYLFPYLQVKYSNSPTGAGMVSNPYGQSYYGIHNSQTNIINNNPVDYSWYLVTGGFGTNKLLWYTTTGGGGANFIPSVTQPSILYAPVQDDTPILIYLLANNAVATTNIQQAAVTTPKLVEQAATQVVTLTDSTSYPVINFVNGANNNPTSTSYLWPPYTRGFAIGGGTTITATTTGSILGSSINVQYNAYINSATNQTYNLVELWKSGASSYYKNTFEIVRTYTPTLNPGFQGNIDHYLMPGNNGVLYSGNIGNITAVLTGTTNNLYDGQMDVGADPTWFGVSSTYGDTSFGTTTIPQRIAAGGSIGSAYPLFNVYGSSILEFTPTPSSGGAVWSPTILVGSGGTIAFWTGEENGYQQGLWAFESSGTFADLNDICADLPTDFQTFPTGTIYNTVAVGSGGTILYNARTLNATANVATSTGWSQAVSNTTVNLRGVQSNFTQPAWNISTRGNLWVAVGDAGTILHSTSGSGPWTPANVVPTTNNLNAVGYTNGYWVAVGDAGTIITSTDADTWTGPVSNPADGILVPSNGVRNLYGIAGGLQQHYWVAAGEEIILTTNTTNPNGAWNSNAYLGGASLNSTLTRLQYQGSWANIANVSQPPLNQRVTNGQVISGSYTDTDYTEGQTITYYLVLGNMAGNVAVTTNGPNMTLTEIKR